MKGATLACPVCGNHIEIIIPAKTPIGTIAEHKCSDGHKFLSRVAATSLEALPESPDSPT
jgi:hypothetical protein